MTRHKHRGSTDRITTYHRDQRRAPAPLPVANDGCLSSRADFIPSWLNHMQNDPPQDIPQPKSPLDANNLSWHPNGLTTVRIQPKSGQYQSSDILIQNSPSQSQCHHEGRESAPDRDHGQSLHDGERHYHNIRPASTTSEAPLTKSYVFEKQPRRKTRRDRYESTKSKDERPEKRKRKKSLTRVSKRGRLQSSREVMDNFRSKAIANPGEKLTLEQKFTPGLFVNGRTSASLADLAFNDIPLNHKNVEKRDKDDPIPESKQRKKRNPRPDETKSFTGALKRLVADYPPPESASHPTGTIDSSDDGNNNERPLQRGSQQDLTAVRSREDLTPNGQDAVDPHKYEDKGVMVSPWLHQRTRGNMPYSTTTADHQFRPRRPESSPNAVFEISPPEVPNGVAEAFDFRGTRIEDTTTPRDKTPPISYFNSTSGPYLSNALLPPFSSGSSPFDRLDASRVIDLQHSDAYSITAANALSQRISQIVDDIPGETLQAYIGRMEREILGADEPSARYIDKALLPAEANTLDTTVQPSKPLREIGYRVRSPQQDRPHDFVDRFPRHYSRLSYPEEDPNESESAFVWQPNYMMWR
ncbi:uncharacterized protein TrAtP1_004506 [Trichoderma atroviride]|uniref:uncharacterized protein n=1 Tax=Hypocrea atroviridis TaxID=63577 RepID=UPI00332C7D43|nr:hypothetical protein TrAtP1_004506 [Trichoderma atroviride]